VVGAVVVRAAAAAICVLLAAFLAAPAAMAAPGPGNGGRSQPIWQDLHEEIENWIDSTGARQAFLNLGVALYMFLGMVQTYSAVMGTSAAGVSETVFRVIMAGFLISLVQNGTIADILGTAYEAFAGAGMAILSRSVGGAYGGLKQRFEDFGRNLTQAIMGHIGLIASVVLAALVGIFVSGVGLAILSIYGVFAALYIVVQLFALVILSIALLLAPLSFAAFAYRGTAGWTWHWVRGVLNALLTVLLANMVAGVVAWLSLRGPETVIRSVAGVGSEIGALVSGVFLPFMTLVIAPFLGIMALLRVETVVAHFSAAFGDFTGTMEQMLASRLLLGQIRWRRPPVGGGGGGGGGGGSGPLGGGGGGGSGGGGGPDGTPPVTPRPGGVGPSVVSSVPPPPRGFVVPLAVAPSALFTGTTAPWAPSVVTPPKEEGDRGLFRRPPPADQAGRVAGGFTGPADASRPPGWESLAEWSQRQFGIDLAPWQRDSSVPVPRSGMSAEELKEIYSKASTREDTRVLGVEARGNTTFITLEKTEPGGRTRSFEVQISRVAPAGSSGRDGYEHEKGVEAGQTGGLRVNVMGVSVTTSGGEWVERSFTMRWDGSVADIGRVKEADGLRYSGDWRARIPGADKGPGPEKGGESR
jgi:hypothetical protein